MRLLLFFIFVFSFGTLFVQQSIPMIKAKSPKADIKCNGKTVFTTGNDSWWSIMPEVNPDIYYTDKLGDTISFHTDKDSISVIIKETTKFDFIVLRGKDSAYTQISYREPYLLTLKKGADYDENQKRNIPQFTYLKSNDKNLKLVRKKFKLDSIAGQGNEISQLINIMNWVHSTIRHDGSSDNPEYKNASDLIEICQKENRGINCRMMATILNECYLAMGFKSRIIICMPKPLEFQDCHVINVVFSDQLNKWIWLDPTFDAYVMNEKGELLGIEEVRERLTKNEPLILNPEANWNRKSSQTKEYYLNYYMAKNLYRLETPINSTFNSETAEKNKTIEYIQLLPLDGINQEPIIKIYHDEKNGMTYKTFITNNPRQFWNENNNTSPID